MMHLLYNADALKGEIRVDNKLIKAYYGSYFILNNVLKSRKYGRNGKKR